MNYQTSVRAFPSEGAISDMVEYVAGDLRCLTGAGVEATDADLDGYRAAADGCEISQFHTFSFENEWPPDELAERVLDATRECRDGEILLGVHDGVYGNAHVHIAEVGARPDVEMQVPDIVEFRESVADRFDGERIGAEA